MADTQHVVKWYQTILGATCGYLNVPVNGNHNDPETKSAFRDFQKTNALEASGFLTVESNFAMNQVALQWIYRRSLDNRIGKFSDELKDLIKEFQSDYDLVADGQVGPKTMEKMVSVLNGTLPSPYAYLQPEFSSQPFLGTELDSAQDEPETVQGAAVTSTEPGVIGSDDREPQSNTTREPNRWVCLLDVAERRWKLSHDVKGITQLENGFRWSRGGTGLLISPRHILTAAHVLKAFGEEHERPRYSKLFTGEVVEVSPGHNGAFGARRFREPYGTVTSKAPYWYPAGYCPFPDNDPNTREHNPSKKTQPVSTIWFNDFLDYALIELPDPIDELAPVQTRTFFLNGKRQTQAQKLPALGYWGKESKGFKIRPVTPAQLDGQEIQTMGYPKRKPDVETKPRKPWMQWLANGTVSNARSKSKTHPFLFFHTADTTSSQSGSPLWTVSRSGGQEVYSLVGIVLAVQTIKNGPESHQAVAMTEHLLRTIERWAPDTFRYDTIKRELTVI